MRYILLSVLVVPVIVILMLFNTYDLPILKVEDLVVEKFASCGVPHHLCSPTAMTFVEEDILILQKNNGVVHQIQDNFWGGKELTEKQLRAIDRMKAGRRLYLEEKKREKEEKRALLKKIRKKQGK